jgi:hypothetical protein
VRFRRRFWDPTGERYGLPTYPWQLAPGGLATRRQLRSDGLRPGGQSPVAQVMWQRRRTVQVAYLYRVDRALPVRPMTSPKSRALAATMLARRTCPICRTDRGYVISVRLGMCVPCADAPPTYSAA